MLESGKTEINRSVGNNVAAAVTNPPDMCYPLSFPNIFSIRVTVVATENTRWR